MRTAPSSRRHSRLPAFTLAAAAAAAPWHAPCAAQPPDSVLVELGRQIFFDASLSASGRLACASCHSERHAYGPPDGRSVRLGGARLDHEGVRAVPSLRYTLARTPVFSRSYPSNEADRELEGQEPPAGGFGWDGRFDDLRQQAAFPLLSRSEMANGSPARLVARLARAPYAAAFRRAFGARSLENPDRAYAQALIALERFELDDPSFHPYSSRYDQFLDGKTELTAQELRGRALFEDPRGGNCASCHPDRVGADGSHPLFTNFRFEALGVPRNRSLQANARADWFDAGLCGPLRRDLSDEHQCGRFKTPTLRNVASRSVFFHNGYFHDLREVLRFYVRRDTDPGLWYPLQVGNGVDKFDDLPTRWRRNVDITEAPLNRAAGADPAWSEEDIDAVLAFLSTLNDRDVADARIS